MIIITLAICTYNRSAFLKTCLESILNQNNLDCVEVLVIDNMSTDNTNQVALDFIDKISNFSIITETNPGLSYARNRAIKEASGKWLAFIDDDVVLPDSYVEVVLDTISKYDFVCFGGNVYPQYLFDKPKWIKSDFESNILDYKNPSNIYTPSFIFGCNMIIKKELFSKVGTFKIDLGMGHNIIGYGEETELIQRILNSNYSVGHVPDLFVYHNILYHKCKLNWHLKAAFSRGIAWQITFNPSKSLFVLILRMIYHFIKKILLLPLLILKLSKKGYFWQNLVVDFLGSILFYFGRLKGKLIKPRSI